MQIYKFRDCLLNTAERSVIRGRQHLDLTTKTFDVLQFLIENGGKVVTKDELLGNVWNGNFVEESNLPVHISKLRRSLDETRHNRFIETVQGTGYRFVAPVDKVGEDEWREIYQKCNGSGSVPTATGQSIALMPLRNESGDTNNDYLIDGLTEDIINRLSHIPGLRVIARDTAFRYKNQEVDVKEVGEILGVSHLLTGRVRTVDDSLVIGIELTSTRDGAQIWGAKYQRQFSEILQWQEELSWTVAERFQVSGAGLRPLRSHSPTRAPESYRLYLKGKYCLDKRSESSLRLAIQFFEEAASLDAGNIYALTEIVECYRLLYSIDHIAYSEFLAKTNPVVNTVSKHEHPLELVEIMYCDLKMLDWRFDEALVHCERALAVNPNFQRARLRYFDLLLQSRQFGRALEQINRIMTVDPLSSLTNIRIGRLYYLMGQVENAIGYLDDALELDPGNWEALAVRAAVFVEMSEFKKALRDFQESLKGQYIVEVLAMIGVVHAHLGDTQKANHVIEKLEELSMSLPRHAMKLAFVHLALGQKAQAYEFLEAAYSKHEPDLRALTYDPRWESIRRESRFKSLVMKVGLPIV